MVTTTGIDAIWALRWPLLTLLLAGGVLTQTYRLDAATARADALASKIEAAAARSELRGAETGQEAVRQFEDRNDADAPVADGVADRVRSVCLQPQASRDLPVPPRAGRVDDSAARTRNAEDRARAAEAERDAVASRLDEIAAENLIFVNAIATDLRMCALELNRLRALQQFVSANGG